jgi:hypothetical protein
MRAAVINQRDADPPLIKQVRKLERTDKKSSEAERRECLPVSQVDRVLEYTLFGAGKASSSKVSFL